MAYLCIGEQHEAMSNYPAAAMAYVQGFEVAQDNLNNLNTNHPLYMKCKNVMDSASQKVNNLKNENTNQ